MSDSQMKDLFRASRLAAGMSQTELSERLNVSQPFISRIENGTGGINWFRHTPKFFAWLRACGVVMEIRFKVMDTKDEPFERFN